MGKFLIDLESGADAARRVFEGARVGLLAEMSDDGVPIVDFDGAPDGGAPARSIVPISPEDRSRSALLVFERNDPRRPIIIGLLQPARPEKGAAKEPRLDGVRPSEASVDGERVVIDAKREMSLRCGKASITLRADGKIVIRGTSLLSRASGVNKIKGAAVEIN